MMSGRDRTLRIAIAHQSIMLGDAIGNDIMGAYRLLGRLGVAVSLICEYLHPALESRDVIVARAPDDVDEDGFDLLLYHHSIEWPLGERLLERHHGPVIVKYHNITPAHFFEPYSERYCDVCRLGREQTRRLLHRPNIRQWQADSTFNANDLREMGVGEGNIKIVPPFMTCNDPIATKARPPYGIGDPIEILFVGRRVPNKGHRHLLQTVAAFRLLFPVEPVRLTVIGAVDDELAGYYRELDDLVRELDLANHVRWLSHLSDKGVLAAFEACHVYLTLSEHEGFCVPIVEAQALGIPVIVSETSAVRETAGDNQLVVPQPRAGADYELVAGLIHEVYWNERLRSQLVSAGLRNVYRRFTGEHIENRVLDDVASTLMPIL